MPYVSSPRFLVLHSLRVKGSATPETVEMVSGVPLPIIEDHLSSLFADGLVSQRTGRVPGWTLTAGGRAAHAEGCALEMDAAACRAEVDDAYRRFVAINEPFLAACTDWQLRESAPGNRLMNDHSDAGYDAGVLGRLRTIDDLVRPLCQELGTALARLGRYRHRLAEARKRVEMGKMEWFTGALIESYHSVWFELHEDLLATLAIERAKEAAR